MSRARDLSKLGNPNVIKADENSVGFGTQVAGNPANPDSSLISAGIVSATAFYGDGSNLDGVASAGLGTALSEIEFNPLTVIYQTSDTLSINQTVTVDPPNSTSNVAYTQYSEVKLEDGADLIIADGDDFIPDILGLSTEGSGGSGSTYGNGVFGTIYADNIERSDGRGAPHFPQGANVVGVLTAASGSFSGNISIGGTLTYEDVTNVDSVGLITARNGINITGGDLNAASNLILKTGGTERVRIQSNGSAQFTPEGSTSNPNLLIETSGDNIRLNSKKDTGNGGLIFVTQNAGTSSERLRISKDGSIGIGGANYGTSGQVLTSGGASAAPQWTTPAGGAWTVLSHHNFGTTNGTVSENRGWTSDYMQVKCVFDYLSCGNATAQGLKCGFYMDTSLGQQGTLNTASNAYRRTGFPLRFTANSNNLWYNGTDTSWVFGNGDTSLYWSGELIFPIATIVGAGNNVDKYAWGIVNRDNESDRVACEHSDETKIIVGAKLENSFGNSWTEGRVTWYGLKKS